MFNLIVAPNETRVQGMTAQERDQLDSIKQRYLRCVWNLGYTDEPECERGRMFADIRHLLTIVGFRGLPE